MRPQVEQLEERNVLSPMPYGLPDIPNGAWVHVYQPEGYVYYQAGNICNCKLSELPADVLNRVLASTNGAFVPVRTVEQPFGSLANLQDLGPQYLFIPNSVSPTPENPMPALLSTGTWIESTAWVTETDGVLTLHAGYRDAPGEVAQPQYAPQPPAGLDWGPVTEFAVPNELLHPLSFQV
jgi:hypothetical protein